MSHSARVRAEIAQLTALLDDEGNAASEFALRHLGEWDPAPAIETEDELRLALLRRRAASRAHSSAGSNADQTLRLAHDYWLRIADYSAARELPAGPSRLVARYMIYSKAFVRHDARIAWMEALDAGILRKRERVDQPGEFAYFIVGLNYKVGDNTFTQDSRGREHREYVDTFGLQAIAVERPFPFNPQEAAEFAKRTPDLSEDRFLTEVGSGKGSIRPIAISKTDLNAISKMLDTSRHNERPVFDPILPTGVRVEPPAFPAPAPSVIQPMPHDLFSTFRRSV